VVDGREQERETKRRRLMVERRRETKRRRLMGERRRRGREGG
jgi:hypothetical protein